MKLNRCKVELPFLGHSGRCVLVLHAGLPSASRPSVTARICFPGGAFIAVGVRRPVSRLPLLENTTLLCMSPPWLNFSLTAHPMETHKKPDFYIQVKTKQFLSFVSFICLICAGTGGPAVTPKTTGSEINVCSVST